MDLPTESVNEDTSSELEVTFVDVDGNEAAPLAASYSIYCLTNNQLVRDVTDIASPNATETIAISQDENALIDRSHPYETRRVTVVASYGVDEKITHSFAYDVRRERGLSEQNP